MQKRDITPAVVAQLVAEQFPHWAHLPVTPVALDGWDNTTFRLGDALSMRLPSHERYVAQIDKEHRWLPVLAPQLPLPIPQPLAKGQPGCGFPRPWSIYRWLDGDPVTGERIGDVTQFAVDLAAFLAALYAIDATDGPSAGQHSFFRGCHVDVWDAQTREAIEALSGELDTDAAAAVWDAALAQPWDARPVWVHGDVAGSNLLVAGGSLRAVIDFGCSAVGDPACDLVMAWSFLEGESRAAFRDGLPFDDATWARGRGAVEGAVHPRPGRAGRGGASVRVARECP
ncbi:MAG: hypothetical protein QOG87_805 [Actinomycetota bacterium]